MKKIILTFAAIAFMAVSCKKDEIKPEPAIEQASAETPAIKECYLGVMKNDTFLLSFETKGTDVPSGKLTYNFFEKDKSDGTITGTIKGDTLFANYIFVSEGKNSEREVVFLKNGNIMIEGYGDVVDDNKGKVIFKDKTKLYFDSKNILTKTDCKE
jgi:hypothetical protein